jgi:cobaltochelatase CobN
MCPKAAMRRLLSALLLLVCAGAVSAAPVRIAYLYSDGNLPGTLRAYKQLLAEQPQLRGQISLSFLTESLYDSGTADDFKNADVLVFDIMNEQLLERFDRERGVDLVRSVSARGKVLAVGEGLRPKDAYLQLGVTWDERARAYWEHSGPANQLSLLKLALLNAGIKGLELPPPEPSLDFGYYYPVGSGGRLFATWEEFDAWRKSNGKHRAGEPRIAVGFYKSTYYTGDTALLHSMIAQIERQGAEAIPVFGYPGAVAFERLLLDPQGNARADAALGFIFNFSDFNSAQLLGKLDIPVLSMVALYGRSEQEWRNSRTGLSLFEGTFQMAVPELAGTIAPTVVGSKERIRDQETGITTIVTQPIESRVTLAVRRALKYAALRSRPNAEKRVALMYYNFPAGKANVGASYLNVAGSLASILQRLKKEGYDVGDGPLDSGRVLEDITTQALNVGGYAPGELDSMLKRGSAARVSAADYAKWLEAYAPALRAKILKDWGTPDRNELMATRRGSVAELVVPLVRYGNIVLLPQPARGWGEDLDKMYHAKDLAPHHQYVATYTWLRTQWHADAIVHLGTHGTLEWLDGRDAGLSEEDAPDALIADLPDLYVYNVDVVGEGLVARRRGMAALIDHMVPPFTKGGLYPELAKLAEAINDHTLNESKSPQLAASYNEQIRKQAIELGIAKDLSLDLTQGIDDETIHKIEAHLAELKSQNIPYGLHALGVAPAADLRASTIEAIVATDRSALPQQSKVLAAEMEKRILTSAKRELDSVVNGLSGRFLPVGSGNEPIRNPEAYPTGKNFYGIDPDKVPKPAAWKLGVQLADEMLADHVKKHGKYPEKVSFVIWGDETMRHEGVLESQIFHLLGTQPVWDSRGKLIDVAVVPRPKLGRPRVDIVIASAAEGMFNNVTVMMDRAVQKVKMVDEAENFVRQHYLATRATLISRGYSEQDADRRASVRIFDEPPGIFNLNTSTIAAASGTWTSDKGMADDYLRKLGHGYGNGFWGEPMEDVFRLALSGTEKVVHSSSTMLYGALDNDDMFMYMGGLATAIRNLDGKSPELVITNTRDPSKPAMTSMDEFIGMEFRSRYVNPKWIEGMQKEGYAGAGEMRAFVEYLWGWDATASEVVDDAMWNETFDVYVNDKHQLGMKEFFERASPYALQDIAARMLETVRKEYWQASDEVRARLLQEYLDSVARHGLSCSETTCGNPSLTRYVIEQARKAGIPTPAIDQFQSAVAAATGGTAQEASQDMDSFVERNEARLAERQGLMQRGARQLAGYLMQQSDPLRSPPDRTQKAQPQSGATAWDVLWIGVPLLMILFLWRANYRARAGLR